MFADAAGETLAAAGLLDPVPSMLAGTYLDICPPSLQQPTLAPWTVGTPLRPSPGEVLATDVLPHGFDRLAERPMVYLTLGTIMNQRPEVFRAALTGCARLPVSVVATTGPGFDPADLGPLPENVMAVPYLAQAQVLPHCAAIVSHTGAGTMLGALCFGLPQLCLPQGTDQPSNAAAVHAGRRGARAVPGGDHSRCRRGGARRRAERGALPRRGRAGARGDRRHARRRHRSAGSPVMSCRRRACVGAVLRSRSARTVRSARNVPHSERRNSRRNSADNDADMTPT